MAQGYGKTNWVTWPTRRGSPYNHSRFATHADGPPTAPPSLLMEDSAHTRDTSEAVAASSKDCLSCRIMGAGLMAGTGSYAIWQSRAAAPGSPAQKKVVAGLGLG
jgi:hypothetical protein